MARPLRIEYPGAWYHVFNRGRRREKIFFSRNDYLKFFDLLSEATRLFSLEVHAYSLMPNHYHLLIRTPNANLSRIMRHLNGVYTQYINMSHASEGSLFKGRYKAILVNDEEYVLELVRYIHRNPYKAKLEERLGEHEWTSHRAYMRAKCCPEWLYTKTVLKRFSRYEKHAKRELGSFVKKEPPKELEKQLDSVRWPAVLGGEGFKEIIKEYICGKRLMDDAIPESKKWRNEISVDEVRSIIEALASKEHGELSRPRRSGCTEAKSAFVYICRHDFACRQSEISKALGKVNGARITRLYRRAVEDWEKKCGAYHLIQKFRNQSSQLVKT